MALFREELVRGNCYKDEFLARLSHEFRTPLNAILGMTTKADLGRCLEARADDFISKPVSRLELTARVPSMLRIRHQYQQLASFNSQLEQLVQ